MTKTNAEYAQHPSVVGLTGAAKKAAIKALYDADKALTPTPTRQKLPSVKAIAEKARAYANAFHAITVVFETEKAVGVNVVIEFVNAGHSKIVTVWVPKSTLKDGMAPGWLLDSKLNEARLAAKTSRTGDVLARFA
jgi:hypothetical protein